MSAKAKMLTAVFQERDAAVRAFNWLQNHGYTTDEINVLMTDRTRSHMKEDDDREENHGILQAQNMAPEGVAAGGAIGTAVGATLAAITALGTAAVAIPVLGIAVAGPIIAGLAGGGAGAVAGGVIGGLIGMGISEPNAKAYEEALRKGGVVFGVVPHSAEDARAIEKYFAEEHADNIIFA